MVFEEYVTVAGQKLRKGYTTGSCAAAAAKAAVQMLVSRNPVDFVSIDTPAGVRLTLPVTDITIDETSAACAVVKDGGDDPDVTNGLKICAAASYRNVEGIEIGAGKGIGTVTLPGLKIEPGQPAINPVPLQMIRKEVAEAFSYKPETVYSPGVKVVISAPGGEEAAQRTFNAKLGIVGGISILGTKGIEEPMSEEALKESLALELKMMAKQGMKRRARAAAFVFGNYGEEFALRSLGLPPQSLIKIGNYIGFMLEKADEYGLESLLLIGHPGKMVKVAAGIFQTHSRTADARAEIFCAYAGLEGADPLTLKEIYQCRTTEAMLAVISNKGLTGVLNRIGENAARRCSEYSYGRLKIGIVLYANDQTLLYQNHEALEIGEEFKQ